LLGSGLIFISDLLTATYEDGQPLGTLTVLGFKNAWSIQEWQPCARNQADKDKSQVVGMHSSISTIGTMPEELQIDFALANCWAIQQELNRLASEIHDELMQHLSAISRQLLTAKELVSSIGGPSQ
jgi:signal transduction histidine kinase